jgi:catechol 2,3-dioxygenase-like lactoylglutathione lyase family enzyme
MIEHVSVPVSNYDEAVAFYAKALAPLGYKLNMEFAPDAAGFMEGEHTSFWISRKDNPQGVHVAFLAKDKTQVENFYNASLGAGGRDNGAPGYRNEYSPGYFAAFILDQDGNNIEAVFYDETIS